jgi:hypothetical protein
MGKLPELFFTKNAIENLNINRKALKLFPFVYLLLSGVPLALAAYSTSRHFAISNLLLFAALVAFSALTGAVRIKVLIHN